MLTDVCRKALCLWQRGTRHKLLCAAVTTLAICLLITPAGWALTLNLGPVFGNFDTNITLGYTWRVSDRDGAIIGTENARYNSGDGTAHSVNGDDGNLNYNRGDLVFNTLKVNWELLLDWKNWSVFSRAFYLYDLEVMGRPTRRTELTNEAKNEIGERFTLLDAYLSGQFQPGSTFLNLKVGNQVVNWGESTFIQHGINSMNTVDVAVLRTPGSELRDALEAIPMVLASWNLGQRFTVEGFYPFTWNHSEIEPAGSFFSTNDFASPGGRRVLLGFGREGISDTELNTGVGAPVGVDVFRSGDMDARDGGEFGVALRWFEPKLGDTEFGFYFTRLHSRLPLISGWTGLLREGFVAGNYAATANYFREFPDEIDTYGFSFNTQLPRLGFLTGMAWQGEVSYKNNQPLQVDDVELLFAALSPLDPFAGLTDPDEGFKLSQLCNGVPFDFDTLISGYRRKDVIQAQTTFTQLFGPGLGADQWTFLTEIGALWVQDMESKDVLRYEGPGTYTSATEWFTQAGIQPATETDGFADDFSWGYRAVLKADLNSAIGSVNLTPAVVWYHDVEGTSPTPILSFVEGRKSITAVLGANYLLSWGLSLSYTNYFGGSRYNLVNDRDFVSMVLSYSF